MFGADTHHPPEHPYNQMTSNTNIRCTVKKPRSALETDEDPRILTTNTSHQVKSTMSEMNMAMVEEKEFEKSEEHEEIDVTHTDRNMQHKKEESKQKLVTTRHQECGLDKVRNTAKRPRSAFDAHENPHTLTTSPPEEPLKDSVENAKPSPITLPVRSSNPTKLKLSSVQSQEDLTGKLAPSFKGHLCKKVVSQENEANHVKKVHKDDSSDSEYLMEKVHKDDSSDSEYLVEKALPYRMEMDVETVKKRKYEVLGETVEINEVSTDRGAIIKDSTYGNSAIGDNAKDDNAKDEQFLLPATPVEQWPTEAPEGPNTKENRSLEGHDGTNQATSDDREKGTTLTKEKMKIGRNNEEEYVLDEDINRVMDVREHDKPLDIDDASKDNDENQNQTISNLL
jgi:hypothetical protein